MWRHAAEPMLDTHGGEASGGATRGSGEHSPPSSGVPRCTATVVTGPPNHVPAGGPGRLRQGLDEFRRTHADSVQSAGRVISPLLDLWSLATAVDQTAAAPIESLLKALIVRTTTTSAELSACANEVEAILNGLLVPPDPSSQAVTGAKARVS